MIGWFHPELRPEAWVSPVLIPEGWMGRDFIGDNNTPPPPAGETVLLVYGSNPGAGYSRYRRKFWFKVA